jgi:HprK-related kinase A
MSGAGVRMREWSFGQLARHCADGGIDLDYGAAIVRVRSRLARFVHDFRALYGAFPCRPAAGGFADYHVELRRGRGLRAFVAGQARFCIDGVEPFDPFPLANALPLFEWGVNWCFAQRANQFLLLHAAVLARGERAVILAAPPGAGKSTLAAAMMLNGFRLLSDEFGVLCLDTPMLQPMLKPVALKNRSVELIRARSPQALLGPRYCGTRKGDVAHLAPDEASVDARRVPARAALLLFPAYVAEAPLALRPLAGEQAFARLAFNSFNYALLGPRGFEAVGAVIDACGGGHQLRYGCLDAAIALVSSLLDGVHTGGS